MDMDIDGRFCSFRTVDIQTLDLGWTITDPPWRAEACADQSVVAGVTFRDLLLIGRVSSLVVSRVELHLIIIEEYFGALLVRRWPDLLLRQQGCPEYCCTDAFKYGASCYGGTRQVGHALS